MFQSPIAKAETKVFSKLTNLDTYNRTDLNSKYDIERVEVGLWDTDLDMIHFWILFKQPLTSQMFNDNQGSWAGILIDINNDSEDDIVINTLARGYTANFSQTASAVYRNGSKSCSAVSWMDLNNNSKWLGFKVSQKCLGLANSFKVQGYSDYIASDNASFDYAPDSYELIDLDDYYKPKPKISLELPEATPDLGKLLTNYSTGPENLVNLSSSLRDSVVTIECINGTTGSTGTAWSAKSTIRIAAYKSYLVTNYHVISDCIYSGKVNVILNNNTKLLGILAAWDPENDLAGIYVDLYVPPLLWQGENPLQGSWVGVIGSPKGLPGVLTTGIISSASLNENFITFTAPINPGNSGGPVFDSTGRVIAIATAKVRDSEGFAIGNGVPLMCKIVMRCSSSLQGWGVKSSQNPSASNVLKQKQEIFYSAPSKFDITLSKKITINQIKGVFDQDNIYVYTSSNLELGFTSLTILTCTLDEFNQILFSEPGICRILITQNGNEKYESTFGEIQIEIIGKSDQYIILDEVDDVSISKKKVNLSVVSTSGLPVIVSTKSNTICSPIKLNSEWQIELKKVGICKITLNQKGDSKFLPALIINSSFRILPPIKTTIVCTKGSSTANITGINPVCPFGYKKSK